MTLTARTIAYGPTWPCAALPLFLALLPRRSPSLQHRRPQCCWKLQHSFANRTERGRNIISRPWLSSEGIFARYSTLPDGRTDARTGFNRTGLEGGGINDGARAPVDISTSWVNPGGSSPSEIQSDLNDRKRVVRGPTRTPLELIAKNHARNNARTRYTSRYKNKASLLAKAMDQVKDETERDIYRRLTRYTTEELYKLVRLAAGKGLIEDVDGLIRELVTERGEQPSLRVYSARILANVSHNGSAFNVASILEEIAEQAIVPDSDLFHVALKALAVHPDSILRGELLEQMRVRWFNLTMTGWHDVVVGYIREDQLELACEYLEDMRQAKVEIQPWLYDVLTYQLLDHEAVNEALELMRRRVDIGELGISSGLWYYFFDVACDSLNHEAMQFVWQHRVRQLYLSPTSGQCLAVLNSCSRQADVSLATDVFRILSERNFVFESLHYELLMTTYLSTGDLKTALTITCIMSGAGMVITPSSLSPVLAHLRLDPGLPLEALEILKEMVTEDVRNIAVEVVTCLIEAASQHNSLNDALTIYKALRGLYPAGPDVHVFNALFRCCRETASNCWKRHETASVNDTKETAMFLADEMKHLKIKPDALTYDRLVLLCLLQEDITDALNYYDEMIDAGFWPRYGTWIAIFEALVRVSDLSVHRRMSTVEKATPVSEEGEFSPLDTAMKLLEVLANDERCDRKVESDCRRVVSRMEGYVDDQSPTHRLRPVEELSPPLKHVSALDQTPAEGDMARKRAKKRFDGNDVGW